MENGFAIYQATPVNAAISTPDSARDVGEYSSVTIGADAE